MSGARWGSGLRVRRLGNRQRVFIRIFVEIFGNGCFWGKDSRESRSECEKKLSHPTLTQTA